MIKFRFHRNTIYLLTLYLAYNVRKIISIIINKVFLFDPPYIYLFMMTFAEMTGGSIIYIYQYSNWKKKIKTKYFGIELIINRKRKAKTDKRSKKIILIFFACFFDFIEYIIEVFYIPNIAKISPTIKTRLGCFSTLLSSFICINAMRFKIGKHHKLSLICMGSCFILSLILEIIYKANDISLGNSIFVHFLVMISLLSISFNDCTERYLGYYNFLNPFLILTGEGTIEFIIAILISINKDPFKEIVKQYEENSAGRFALLIFLLIIHFILSIMVNTYKVYCNIVYNPMIRSLAEYFLNPFFNIYFYIEEGDFYQNFFYFIVCEIINIIIDFSFYIFNEYLTLYCCGLEYDTENEIHLRAINGEIGAFINSPDDFDIESDIGSNNGDKELNEIIFDYNI